MYTLTGKSAIDNRRRQQTAGAMQTGGGVRNGMGRLAGRVQEGGMAVSFLSLLAASTSSSFFRGRNGAAGGKAVQLCSGASRRRVRLAGSWCSVCGRPYCIGIFFLLL